MRTNVWNVTRLYQTMNQLWTQHTQKHPTIHPLNHPHTQFTLNLQFVLREAVNKYTKIPRSKPKCHNTKHQIQMGKEWCAHIIVNSRFCNILLVTLCKLNQFSMVEPQLGMGENRPSKSAQAHTHRFVMGRGALPLKNLQNCPNPVRESKSANNTQLCQELCGVDSVWILDTVYECVLRLCSCVEWIYTNVAWNASGDHKFTWLWRSVFWE